MWCRLKPGLAVSIPFVASIWIMPGQKLAIEGFWDVVTLDMKKRTQFEAPDTGVLIPSSEKH